MTVYSDQAINPRIVKSNIALQASHAHHATALQGIAHIVVASRYSSGLVVTISASCTQEGYLAWREEEVGVLEGLISSQFCLHRHEGHLEVEIISGDINVPKPRTIGGFKRFWKGSVHVMGEQLNGEEVALLCKGVMTKSTRDWQSGPCCNTCLFLTVDTSILSRGHASLA